MYDSSGRGIGTSQRPLFDNTQHSQQPLLDNRQHSQQTDTHAPGGIRSRNPNNRAAAEIYRGRGAGLEVEFKKEKALKAFASLNR